MAVNFTSEIRSLAFELTARDAKVCCSMQFPNLRNLTNLIASSSLGAKEPVAIDRLVYLDLARLANKELEESGNAECLDYQFNMPPAHTWVGKGQSGFKVNGNFSRIHAGPGTLYIASSVASAKSVPLDMRGLSSFITDSGEEIKFRKRRRESGLARAVRNLLEFLRESAGMPVVICRIHSGAET